jgi:hypothetical protein
MAAPGVGSGFVVPAVAGKVEDATYGIAESIIYPGNIDSKIYPGNITAISFPGFSRCLSTNLTLSPPSKASGT